MTTTKRFRAPLVVLSGVIMSVVTLAGPASAVTYAPAAGVTVLGTTATAATPTVLGTTASAPSLAFTGTNAIGIGALGGLLLVGGGAMVLVGKRRKVNG